MLLRLPMITRFLITSLLCLSWVSPLQANCASLTIEAFIARSDLKNAVFFNGLLIKLDSGKEVLAICGLGRRHARLLAEIKKKYPGLREILWAGELEIIKGKIARANETAGITQEMPEILNQAMMENLTTTLNRNAIGRQILSPDFHGQKFGEGELHLSDVTTASSYFRHDFNNDITPFFMAQEMLKESGNNPQLFTIMVSAIDNTLQNIQPFLRMGLSNLSPAKTAIFVRALTQIKKHPVKLSADKLKELADIRKALADGDINTPTDFVILEI